MSELFFEYFNMTITIIIVSVSFIILCLKFYYHRKYKSFLETQEKDFSVAFQENVVSIDKLSNMPLVIDDSFEKDENDGESPCDWSSQINIDTDYTKCSKGMFFSIKEDF